MIDNKTASHIAGLARFAAMDAMYKQAQQPVAPGSLGKNLGNYGVKSRAPDKGYVYPPAAPSQRSLPPFKAGVGGAAAAAAGASGLSGQAIRGGLGALGGGGKGALIGALAGDAANSVQSAGQQSMTNPTPTGDLPNFYDQEMYELNRPENQATFPNYSSGSSLKPEIQAGFPEEWFGNMSRVPIYGGWATDGVGDPRWRSRISDPERAPVPPDPGWMGGPPHSDSGRPDYINPGKREGDPAAGFKDLLPDLGGGLEPPSPYSRQPLGSAPPGR